MQHLHRYWPSTVNSSDDVFVSLNVLSVSAKYFLSHNDSDEEAKSNHLYNHWIITSSQLAGGGAQWSLRPMMG